MFQSFVLFFDSILGLYQEPVSVIHIINRTLLIYFGAIILFRINKQILGIKTVFNLVINILIGSILANGITGGTSFISACCAVLTLVICNLTLEVLAYWSPLLNKIISGSSLFLIKNGQIQWKNMQKNLITEDELVEELHLKLQTEDLSIVKDAYFETTGQISFIKK